MDKTRGERVGRRVSHEIPARIHVIQKICDGVWFVLSVQRNIENARA